MWKNGHCLLQKVAALIQSWSLLCPKEMQGVVYGSVEQDETYLIKSSQDYCLNQVNNKWESYLFQSGNDWRNLYIPEEAMLVDGTKLEQTMEEAEMVESVYVW
jgi:hypothetical protein